MLADPRSEALSTRFASQWLRLQDVEKVRPDHHFYSVLGHDAVAGDGARDRTVRRQPDSRGSPGHRLADRRPHLRQRAARQALRHPEHPRRRVPARDHCRSQPPRRAGPGQRAAADLDRRSHVAGAARQVGDGSAARLAAAPAAAERAAARGDEGRRRRQDAVDARAHGRASQEPVVQLVPPRDRPARPRARELRCHRRLAHQGQRRRRRSGRRPL